MIKIELATAFWTQSVSVGNNTDGKSLTPNAELGRRLWYLGHGVLVEQTGRRDILIPVTQVLKVEPLGEVSADEWAGWPKEPEASGPSGPIAEGIKAFTGLESRFRTDDEVRALGEAAAKQYGAESTKAERKKPGPKPKGI